MITQGVSLHNNEREETRRQGEEEHVDRESRYICFKGREEDVVGNNGVRVTVREGGGGGGGEAE